MTTAVPFEESAFNGHLLPATGALWLVFALRFLAHGFGRGLERAETAFFWAFLASLDTWAILRSRASAPRFPFSVSKRGNPRAAGRTSCHEFFMAASLSFGEGLSRGTQKQLDGINLTKYNADMKPNPKRVIAIKMKAEGATYKQIGKALGCSPQYAQLLVSPHPSIRKVVRERASDKCEACQVYVGRSGHIHHMGGNEEDYNDLERLELLCLSCHRRRHLDKSPKPTASHDGRFILRKCLFCWKSFKVNPSWGHMRHCSTLHQRYHKTIRYLFSLRRKLNPKKPKNNKTI